MISAGIPLRSFEYTADFEMGEVIWSMPPTVAATEATTRPQPTAPALATGEAPEVLYDIVFEMDAVPFDWSPVNLQVPEVDSAPARFDFWKHLEWSLRWPWWAPPANDPSDELLDEERLFLDFLIEQMVTTC